MSCQGHHQHQLEGKLGGDDDSGYLYICQDFFREYFMACRVLPQYQSFIEAGKGQRERDCNRRRQRSGEAEEVHGMGEEAASMRGRQIAR